MKKLFAFLLTATLLSFAVFAAPSAVETVEMPAETNTGHFEVEKYDSTELMGTYGDLTYSISGGKVTITGCSNSASFVIVPSEIEGYPVKSIQIFAFHLNVNLVSIKLPEGLETIGDYAFDACLALSHVGLPSTIKKSVQQILVVTPVFTTKAVLLIGIRLTCLLHTEKVIMYVLTQNFQKTLFLTHLAN